MDKYVREQDVHGGPPPGPTELGPTDDKDIRYLKWSERSEESRQNERECEDCGQVRDLREMIQMPDGAWYCQPCAENIPDEEEKADIDEETEQIEAIEKELHGKDHELESGWKKRGMKLLTQADREKLPKLYGTEGVQAEDKVLRVKFFTPTSSWTWYAVEFDGDDTFYGYVEGQENEWGYFSLQELSDTKGPMGVGIERDKYWEPIKFGDYIAKKG